MADLISFVVLVFGILQIILFFKVWVMTDNVAKITKYIDRLDNSYNQPSVEKSNTAADDDASSNEDDVNDSVPTRFFEVGDSVWDKKK